MSTVEGTNQENNYLFCKCFYQTNDILSKKCFFGIIQENVRKEQLVIFESFAEVVTNFCCSACSRCQDKLTAGIHLNAVFTKENKDKAI